MMNSAAECKKLIHDNTEFLKIKWLTNYLLYFCFLGGSIFWAPTVSTVYKLCEEQWDNLGCSIYILLPTNLRSLFG